MNGVEFVEELATIRHVLTLFLFLFIFLKLLALRFIELLLRLQSCLFGCVIKLPLDFQILGHFFMPGCMLVVSFLSNVILVPFLIHSVVILLRIHRRSYLVKRYDLVNPTLKMSLKLRILLH